MLVTLTAAHVVLSLVGIVSGFVVVTGLMTSKRLDGWTVVFLGTTAATTVTGFLFPFQRFLPSHGAGILSALILAAAIFARYRRHLAGAWRRTYAITAVIALYLNVFVLIVQLFLKVPPLHALAPTQTEPPFKLGQLAVLVLFLALGILAAARFRNETLRTA
ncbi:MAG TPA: hypothetical protein VMW75_22295 [Thermoanaerobaculia bacterium]|nr:hypothetical protein [Thermoanaerobaculia bacterium]